MAVKKKARKKAVKKHAVKKAQKIPRQRSIPGMEDTKIASIENKAFDYAELRDERVALSAKEVELKKKLIEAMHNAGKDVYKRNGVSVKLTIEKEGVKVRVKEDDNEDLADEPETEQEETEEEEQEQGDGEQAPA